MTSKGVLENREEQPLEIVKGHARSLMVGRRFGRSGRGKFVRVLRCYQTDNVVFGRQCRNSDRVTAAPLSRSRIGVPRAKKRASTMLAIPPTPTRLSRARDVQCRSSAAVRRHDTSSRRGEGVSTKQDCQNITFRTTFDSAWHVEPWPGLHAGVLKPCIIAIDWYRSICNFSTITDAN